MSEMSLPIPALGRCPDCNRLLNESRCPKCGQKFERPGITAGTVVHWKDLRGEAFYKAFDEAFGLKPLAVVGETSCIKTHMKSTVQFDVPRTLCGIVINKDTQTVENSFDSAKSVTCNNCVKILKIAGALYET